MPAAVATTMAAVSNLLVAVLLSLAHEARASGSDFVVKKTTGAGSINEENLYSHRGSGSSSDASASKPNIMLVVADDLGWSNVGWHSPDDEQVRVRI